MTIKLIKYIELLIRIYRLDNSISRREFGREDNNIYKDLDVLLLEGYIDVTEYDNETFISVTEKGFNEIKQFQFILTSKLL